MSHKFDKNRSVSVAYCKIPLHYTQIFYANDKNKQLVLMDRIGKNYTACWRNNELNKVGIEFLLKAVDKPRGFIFKDKFIKLSNCNEVW